MESKCQRCGKDRTTYIVNKTLRSKPTRLFVDGMNIAIEVCGHCAWTLRNRSGVTALG